MRPLIALAFITLVSGFVRPALAEGVDPNAGMHYTKIQDAPASDNSYIKLRTIKHEDEQPDKAEEPSQVRIWNKYKALASGKAGEEDAKKDKGEDAKNDESDDEDSDAKDSKKAEDNTPEKVEREPAPQSGFAALLDEYKKNKAARSQMHTITVMPPEEAKAAEAEAAAKKPGT